MTLSKPNYSPKVSSPDTIALGVKASTYEWWGVRGADRGWTGTIQSIAGCKAGKTLRRNANLPENFSPRRVLEQKCLRLVGKDGEAMLKLQK